MSAGVDVLKAGVLKQVVGLLEIPFNSVYSYADNFFELKELPFGDKSLKSQVKFMQSCRLKDIQFANTSDAATFEVINQAKKKSISFSNRTPTRGELRGECLRQQLLQAKTKFPNKTLYDFLNQTVKSKQYSDLYTMIKKLLCSEASKTLFAGNSMKPLHFELFTSLLINHVETQIAQKKIKANTNPATIRKNIALQQSLLAGINLSDLYDLTSSLIIQLDLLLENVINFKENGFRDVAMLAQGLYQQLTDEVIAFCHDEQSLEQFFECYIDSVSQGTRAMVKVIAGSNVHKRKEKLSQQSSGIILLMKQLLNAILSIRNALQKQYYSAESQRFKLFSAEDIPGYIISDFFDIGAENSRYGMI